jgi:hypothetical protein
MVAEEDEEVKRSPRKKAKTDRAAAAAATAPKHAWTEAVSSQRTLPDQL